MDVNRRGFLGLLAGAKLAAKLPEAREKPPAGFKKTYVHRSYALSFTVSKGALAADEDKFGVLREFRPPIAYELYPRKIMRSVPPGFVALDERGRQLRPGDVFESVKLVAIAGVAEKELARSIYQDGLTWVIAPPPTSAV